MNKWLVLLLVIVLGIFGWYYASTALRITPPWREPKFGKVDRGDIRVPITAAGLIRPKQEIEIKPEASGKVLDVPIVEGKSVKMDELLVLIDPQDEQRNVDRAKADVARLELQLEQAEFAIKTAKANTAIAVATLEEAKATLKVRQFDYENVKDRAARGGSSQLESVTAESQVAIASANVDRSTATLTARQVDEKNAEASKKIQEQLLKNAETVLADAERRLSRTKVTAPQDAVVTTVNVREGNVVQSGTESFTGGTVVAVLADVSAKTVIARVDESDYGRVLDISPIDALPEMPGLRSAAQADAEAMARRGGVVTLSIDAFPDDTFEGRIERVEPQGKLNVGSAIIQYDVHVLITDAQAAKLPLGAQATVEFTVESAVDVIRVPAEAVKSHEGERGVWVKTPPPEGSTERHGRKFVPCKFGISNGEVTEVLRLLVPEDELKPDAEVYTKLPATDDD